VPKLGENEALHKKEDIKNLKMKVYITPKSATD
jgi:hypothetical protein